MARLVPLKVLDEFRSAGVFVNWWQEIRFDLKTIVSTGWHHSLIPDEYLIDAFFGEEADEIERLEAGIGEAQGELIEAVEAAVEVAAWEPGEGEKATAAVLKKALKALIADLKDSTGPSARKELKRLQEQDGNIKAIEKRLREAKAALKDRSAELQRKLRFKRTGVKDYKTELQALVDQVDAQLAALDLEDRTDKRKAAALSQDRDVLAARIARAEALVAEIGGEISEAEARGLILAKLYDVVRAELERYLGAEKRGLVLGVENLWEKYAASSRELEAERDATLKKLDKFLHELSLFTVTTNQEWQTTPLGGVADIVMGQSPDSSLYSEEEVGLPFLQGCAEFGSKFPRHKLFCSQSRKVARTGSILFSVRAPVGKLNIADWDYVIGRGLASISGKTVITEYLEHFLRSEEDGFRAASQGSTFEAINSNELAQWPIFHPTCRHEQKKIAEAISTVDQSTEQTAALIEKQQRIKAGLMQDLLTHGIDGHGNFRTEQTHKFKDPQLGHIPKE